MVTVSVKHDLGDACEVQLQRLRQACPHLENRIQRAERILVAQLSLANGHKPIKVRVRADGTRAFSVRSGSKMRVAYTVEPDTFVCSCPWAESGQSGCCHSISCWVLSSAGRRVKTAACDGCGSRFRHSELTEVHPEHVGVAYEVLEGQRYCTRCSFARGVE